MSTNKKHLDNYALVGSGNFRVEFLGHDENVFEVQLVHRGLLFTLDPCEMADLIRVLRSISAHAARLHDAVELDHREIDHDSLPSDRPVAGRIIDASSKRDGSH